MTPAEIVSLLSITTPDLSSRIGTMTKVWSTPDLKITGRFHYIKFRDSKPTVEDLVLVAHARMVNFFIPRKRIDEAIAEMTTKPTAIDPWVFFATEARDLFIKTRDETGRSGELGEVLLYMLMEWVLSAPIPNVPLFLEMGGSSGVMINLMAIGLSRTTAEALTIYIKNKEMGLDELKLWLQSQKFDSLDISPACIREVQELVGKLRPDSD